jgi:hypothetical protein
MTYFKQLTHFLHIVSNCLQCHRLHHHHVNRLERYLWYFDSWLRKQVIDLFDKIKPNNQITIGYKKLTALPKNGGAKVFEGASDAISITFKYSCLFIKYFNFLRQLTTRQLLKISHHLFITSPFKNLCSTILR